MRPDAAAPAPTAPAATLRRLRRTAPLVHCITNAVAADLVANAVNAIGARPVMAPSSAEAEEIVAASAVLTINIGMPDEGRVAAMAAAAEAAGRLGRPWVLDPVAVGATAWRRAIADRLLALRPGIVRGNASEILALDAGGAGHGAGVDATEAPEAAETAAISLARRHGMVVAVTGAVDIVTDGARTLHIAGGHPLMARVSGMGCALTAVVGACRAVTDDPLAAAADAVALFAAAGARVGAMSAGPGSFRMHFLDALDRLGADALTGGSDG